MALQPCDYCHRVPRGKLLAFIVAWYSDKNRIARRIRCCDACYLPSLSALGAPVPTDGEYLQLPEGCPLCMQPVLAEELREIYVTVFGHGETERDTFVLCGDCAAARLAELASTGEPMADRPLYSRRRNGL